MVEQIDSGAWMFAVMNNHIAACGDAPAIRAEDPKVYCGYFQNSLGEQAIFTCDRRTGIAELRMGDTGWQNVYRVEAGTVEGLMLNSHERAWLAACWDGSVHFREGGGEPQEVDGE